MDKDNLGDHYPKTWDEFIGQEPVKRTLRIAARSAAKRHVPLGHTLLSSPVPGIGKTSLAMLTAMEMGSKVKVQSGPLKPAELQYLFMDLQDGDVLFLDEIHRLADGGKKNAEWLLHVMENGMISTPLGLLTVPDITIIGATTDAGKLPQPVLDRFEVVPALEPYSDADGAEISIQLGRKILAPLGLPLPTPEVAVRIAAAGNNAPRQMRRVLCHLRDLVFADEISCNNGAYDLAEALDMAGVTPDGLPVQAQKYLMILMQDFRGNPAGMTTLADRLGETKGGMTELERILLGKNLIGLTGRGRMLTPDGMRRAQELAA